MTNNKKNEIRGGIRVLVNGDKTLLALQSCKEYSDYLKNLGTLSVPDYKGSEISECNPEDGMTLSQLGLKSDEELLSIANNMGKVNHKSDIRVMYASGYCFSWTNLTTIMEFKDFIDTTHGSNTPHFVKKGASESSTYQIHNVNQSGIIIIQDGRMKNVSEIRNKIDDDVNQILKGFLNGYKDTDKPKILSKIIERGLGDLPERKTNGEKVVMYPAVKERFF